ncbi:MAG: 50S ribosomal protein L6 [Puniceicoccales bacterium]|jgi:large subunit ribosomal protein L6|nr:50S ribosomal protein L6 [Puniceicoccales bacterium]
MSRIGKLPIVIPQEVKVTLAEESVSVSGVNGSISQSFDRSVEIKFNGHVIEVFPKDDSRHARAMHGTVRSIINNMVQGVQKPYAKDLEIQGVGFKAILKGNVLDLALGRSHPILYPVPSEVKVTIKDNTAIHVEGVDKFLVGKVAADIKRFYPMEPYKGKGVRIAGEYVRRKEGKKSAK